MISPCHGEGQLRARCQNLRSTKNAATLLQVLRKDHPHIQKLTLSTALAQAAEKVEQKLPPQYVKYARVFDEPKGGELPPWRPFDHGIELKETFTPKVAKS